MKTHYADVFAAAGETEEVTGAMLVEALDTSMDAIRSLIDLKNHLENVTKNMDTKDCDKKVHDPFHDFFSVTPPHDPIMDFLRDNKLL